MLIDVVLTGVGLFVLARAADEFVLGAARISIALQVSPVIVGAVIVGFGTSAPEMLVSGVASYQGDLDAAVGNVIGSNVANLTLVLGAATMVRHIDVNRIAVRREAPLATGAVIVFALMIQGGLSRWEGALLVVLLVAALYVLLSAAKREGSFSMSEIEDFLSDIDGVDDPSGHLTRESVRTGIGLVATVLGAWLLVEGAIGIAERVGLSGGFVGFTLLALGTSLPESATAAAAARKGETDLIVGNLLGSNLFNSLAVGATIALVGAGEVSDEKLQVWGAGIMVGVAVLVWVLMITSRAIKRIEGALLLTIWLATVPLLFQTRAEEERESGLSPIVIEVGDPDDAAPIAGHSW